MNEMGENTNTHDKTVRRVPLCIYFPGWFYIRLVPRGSDVLMALLRYRTSNP